MHACTYLGTVGITGAVFSTGAMAAGLLAFGVPTTNVRLSLRGSVAAGLAFDKNV